MDIDFTLRTEDMPADMQVLLGEYPRDSWEGHAGFKDKTRHWLGAHQMFRRLGASLRKDAEHFLDRDMDAQDYAERLSRRGNGMVMNLHGHHGWEDRSFFPELSQADARFDAGLEVLESDHAELDRVLEAFTNRANRTLKLVQLDEASAREEAVHVHQLSETIEAFLARHLADEEELAVPIILHHRLRG